MTKLKVDYITNVAGTGAPNIPTSITIAGNTLSSINTMEQYVQNTTPSNTANAAIWFNSDTDAISIYLANSWIGIEYTNLPVPYGARGIYSGAWTSGSTYTNDIYYATIESSTSATTFGDLTQAKSYCGASSTGSTAVISGGFTSSGATNVIEYFTIATTGNGVDFGDITAGSADRSTAYNTTYTVTRMSSTGTQLYYINMSTPGNSTDFGNLSVSRSTPGAIGSGDIGIFAGGSTGTYSRVNTIDYISITTPGNAVDFGDMTSARAFSAGMIDAAGDAYFAGGSVAFSSVTTVDKVSPSTPGNATVFGNLTFSGAYMGGASNGVKGMLAGASDFSTEYSHFQTINLTTGATASYSWPYQATGIAGCSGD